MIEEDYVSFEVAKLLKEKGFNEVCENAYNEGGVFVSTLLIGHHNGVESFIVNNQTIFPYKAPTHQMAMKWLREEKHYYIQIMLDSWALGGHSGYYIVIQDVNSDFSELSPTEQVFFETHEDAVEAALKYCLEKLI